MTTVKRVLSLHAILTLCVLSLRPIGANAQQGAFTFEYTVQGGTYQVNYLLFLPDGYDADSTQKWPLIFYHHGAGEKGDNIEDIEKVNTHGPPKIVEEQPDFPFVVLSPQRPTDFLSNWESFVAPAMALLDEVLATYSIDANRVYITGISQGAYATWELSITFPDRFAAVVPIAGGLWANQNVCNLKDVPVWVFHGDSDTVVPPSNSSRAVESLEGCNGNVKFTLYPDVEHDSWTITYADQALYDWLLRQSLEASVTSIQYASTWGKIKQILNDKPSSSTGPFTHDR